MSRRRFYLIAVAIVAASLGCGYALQLLLPFWLGLGTAVFVGFVIGNAAAQEFLHSLLPPDE